MCDGRLYFIARFEGGRNVERITDRHDDEGDGTSFFDHVDPEFQETTYPRVFQHEQLADAIFFIECRAGAFVKLFGNRRSLPV